MEKTLKLCAVQMCAAIGDKENNYSKVKKMFQYIEYADVVVLPEVWNIGWDCEIFRQSAENINNSETISFLKNLAADYNVNVVGGSLITIDEEGIYHNSCPVIDKSGNLIKIYNKNHLYSYYGSTESCQVSKGANPVLAEIDGIKFGLTICYDIRFPEIYRAYRKAGADVLINCAAWANTKPIPWEMMTKSRAIENQSFMVAVNQYGPMQNGEVNLGHSRIIDYNGNTLAEILDGEGVIEAEIKLNEMYDFRNKCTILNDIKETYEVI